MRRADDCWPLVLERMHAPRGGSWQFRAALQRQRILPISVDEYLQLLDWTGRRLVDGKPGTIPSDLAPILQRLGIEPNGWFLLASDFGRLYYRIAGGCCATLRERPRRSVRTSAWPRHCLAAVDSPPAPHLNDGSFVRARTRDRGGVVPIFSDANLPIGIHGDHSFRLRLARKFDDDNGIGNLVCSKTFQTLSQQQYLFHCHSSNFRARRRRNE